MEKDVSKGNIGTKEAKDSELDERPRPIRKAENTAVPEADEAVGHEEPLLPEAPEILVVDGNRRQVTPGGVIYIPANTLHHATATADSDVVFFTVKDTSHGLHGIKAG